MGEPLDWSHVYLLGWYGSDGQSCLSSWMGEGTPVECVVMGADYRGPPLWSAPVPPRCKALPLPPEVASGTIDAKIAYATEQGGVYAFGWWVGSEIKRRDYNG